MKPNKRDHDVALDVLCDLCFSDFKFEAKLADSVNCLRYCAGMYARNESVHYSRAEFEAALQLVKTATCSFRACA